MHAQRLAGSAAGGPPGRLLLLLPCHLGPQNHSTTPRSPASVASSSTCTGWRACESGQVDLHAGTARVGLSGGLALVVARMQGYGCS
jgi:hypothetical protein